jgi:hypothetical protein
MAKDELRSGVTSSKPRDEKGKFISVPDYKEGKNIAEKFLLSHTGNYKDQDDLLDIRIGNPLGRIIVLLEDIKKQKAFSFTLKGSLGVAGVVLFISMFGLFGGSKVICDKGLQTEVGMIKVLKAREIYSRKVPVISYLINYLSPSKKLIKNRSVLVSNNNTIYIPFSENIDISPYVNRIVYATGEYNSCTNTLEIDDPSYLEIFSQ